MKFALVTGGSRGIGRAISVKMVSLGYHVLVNYKSNEAEAAQTLSMIKEAGGSGELIRFAIPVRLPKHWVNGPMKTGRQR
jgi:3-oxoacyl-[acyl-carrier protein] reductase